MKCPVFLLSLPRSGSTLMQRILAKHEQIATVSEPWFLLPLLYAQREEGTLTEYSHRNCQIGITDLFNELPDKQSDFDEAINLMATDIYQKLCSNSEVYFLDKTPRYHLIANDLVRIFPNAKFIFLFRNPMDIYASVMTTWGSNSFKKIYAAENDLNTGFQNLIAARKLLHNKCLVVNYENLVMGTKKVIDEITTFLEIENTLLIGDNLIQLSGKLGDQVGNKKYKKVNSSSIGNWKKCFNTSYRKKDIKNYISSIKSSHLEEMGYDKTELLNSISKHNVSINLSLRDRWHILFSKTATLFNGHLLFTDVYKWARKKYLS